MTQFVYTRVLSRIAVASALLSLSTCVDHRPIRNGLTSEGTYVSKLDLTQPNPKSKDLKDDGWLFKVTVVKTSAPNGLGHFAFPGLESDVSYIKFRFREDALQVIDARELQADTLSNPNDNLGTAVPRVMLEFPGRNVDVQLRQSLDGERTNYQEENSEKPWHERTMFHVDFQRANLDPVTAMSWLYGDLLSNCARNIGTTLVPDSFEWDAKDQAMNFVVEATYGYNSLSNTCYDMTNQVNDTTTATVQYRFSFYRPGETGFTPEVIAEKDPVNKKYGVFQVLEPLRDDERTSFRPEPDPAVEPQPQRAGGLLLSPGLPDEVQADVRRHQGPNQPRARESGRQAAHRLPAVERRRHRAPPRRPALQLRGLAPGIDTTRPARLRPVGLRPAHGRNHQRQRQPV